MLRQDIKQRKEWQKKAAEFGFKFHTMHGETYWDESAFYQFSLNQIENDLEQPTEEIHQMCLEVVNQVVHDEEWLTKFKLPPNQWEFIRDSWLNGDPSLYSRLDFAYDGKNPAKLYENNADTPTSIYETGFWQWLWLQDNVDGGKLNRGADQFNSLQEKLVNRFFDLQVLTPNRTLHFACCKDTEEDRGTVQYLEDCANAAGVNCKFVYVEDIGVDKNGNFTDLDNQVITWMFKLYPWEFMMAEEYGQFLGTNNIRWIEPPWKAVLSNKALMPALWKMFPDHPNLLPSFFEDELNKAANFSSLVKKPLFSREGANISIINGGKEKTESDGPYGDEGFIYQATHFLPKFSDNYTLIGSWLVDDTAAGISIREDKSPVTQDMSRFLPHIILG
ncbi:glutathionylspermidine synthase family protein [Psychrosphaera sp. B3R10]|uniref:glutathionylspermidine synthase family protein n=1 Tax=unclassified Psychrosphaera TaxID=2641570 RepID=UPI001C0886F5|nr:MULTISPECIES: glutathionylspermidine synthase family protein [unclassified Psychrosphaera]MBU2881127.1 glutathionylspermidine synthase family protein [Psychrosphaera sp. I2R16]MBU2990051.1 glutathionylspermidine synthase family protein [Psychrosphaera sp. B3R10]MDO6721166.1 glutathionylspermidine synthase family protein [Psychrosphaera sp. 1_MG-2023]